MSVEVRRTPASYRAASQARVKLAELNRHEQVARWCEQETSAMLRQQFAQSYRELVGVDPAQRHELRAALERVAQGGGMPVDDVLAGFR